MASWKILLSLFLRNVLIVGLPRPYFVLFGLRKSSFVLFVLPYFLSYRQSFIVTSYAQHYLSRNTKNQGIDRHEALLALQAV